VKKVLEDELKTNRELKEQVNFKRKQGLVGRADVLEIDMRKASLQARLLDIKEALVVFKNRLRQRAFLEPDSEMSLKGSLPHEHFHAEAGDLLKASSLYNQNYLSLKAKTKANAYELEALKTLKLPSIKLRARYGKMRVDEKYAENSLEGLAGVYLEIPLFDGGERSAKIATQKAALAKESLKLRASEKSLKIKVLQQLERMKSIHDRVDLAEVNAKNGFKYYKEVADEYKRGVKNSLDLASARDRYLEFKIDLLKSKKDFIVTKLELEEVAGVSLD
jgi:outer membrane protein TolC